MGSHLTIPAVAGAEHRGSSFAYSFSFLPKYQREALKTVYTFCRTTDDIVDNTRDVRSNIERLSEWRRELEQSLHGQSSYTILNQLSGVIQRFHIPVTHVYELLKGVEMDLIKNRYATFDELKDYCYHVASSVGLMSMGIFGPRNEQTKEYAINLGIALQLTNIIRDVGIDAKYGRIYIPQEDIRKFQYSEEEIFAQRYSPQFIELMKFQTERAEMYFRLAQESLPPEDRRAMFAAKIMERIYYHTLLRIKEARYDVFQTSIHLPKSIQFLIALKYWLKQRLLGA